MADNSATEKSMQEVATSVESILYPKDQEAPEEPVEVEDDEVSDDEETLPEDDDSDSEDDEGSDEVADEDYTLAKLLGVDEDRLVEKDGELLFNAIIDGETKQVPLKELASSYQLQSYVNNKSIALENERKEFKERSEKFTQELEQRVSSINSLAEYMEKELVSEYNSIDWDALRSQDPATWAALRQEYAEKASKVQQSKQLAEQETERLRKEQSERFQEQFNEHLRKERDALLKDNPAWVDSEVRKKDLASMKTFLVSTYNYSEDDIASISDHRLINLVRDAQAYHQGKKAAETKRVSKPLPKFQKPGAARSNSENLAKAREAKALKARVKKTGHVNDVAAMIRNRM